MDINKFFSDFWEKNASGNLTVGEAIIGHFYRILEGEHAGKVIIRTNDAIDGKPIIRFANGFTWCWVEKIKDIRCEVTSPTFGAPQHEIDYSKATWYPDGSDQPMHYTW